MLRMPKSAKRKTPPENAYALKYQGNESFGRIFMEALNGFDEAAESMGYPGLPRAQVRQRMAVKPSGWDEPPQGPQMIAIHPHFMMEVVALVHNPITEKILHAAVAPFFTMVFTKLSGMFTKKKRDDGAILQYPVIYKPALYLEADQVLVTALMTIDKPEDYKCAETLVPQAFERAIAWLGRNGRQGAYLTYRITKCQLSAFPAVSDTPPEA